MRTEQTHELAMLAGDSKVLLISLSTRSRQTLAMELLAFTCEAKIVPAFSVYLKKSWTSISCFLSGQPGAGSSTHSGVPKPGTLTLQQHCYYYYYYYFYYTLSLPTGKVSPADKLQ